MTRRLRVLIGCEESGAVQRAFEALGHDAWSCDLKATRGNPARHYQCDLFEAVDDGPWDVGIMFPECTYLANSGSKHLYLGMKKVNGICPERWSKMEAGAAFFNRVLDLGPRASGKVKRLVVENPIQHEHARKLIRIYNQVIEPWHHGHRQMKATCLWLDGAAPLFITDNVGPPPKDKEERKAWSAVHRMPPGPNRQRDRSATFPGIAAAFAMQIGGDAR